MVFNWLTRKPSPGGGQPPALNDDGGPIIRTRDTELHLWEGLGHVPTGDPKRIYLYKDRRFLSALARVLDGVAPKRIVEIGILNGGSTIYWAERYKVEKLIAFELATEAPYLTQYLERHGLTEKVRIHFSVSQSDRPAIRNLVLRGLDGTLIDVVIDDASHQYVETRASLEVLFPLVRPGGAYVIEDWAWGHHKNWPPETWANQPLMSPLLTELMLICGKGDGVIDRIDIDTNFAVIWRGAAPLPQDGSFDLARYYVPRGFSIAL